MTPAEFTDISVDEAKAITNRIRQHLETALVEIKKAWTGRAWIALGYDSWDAYCTAEFGDHVQLPRDGRRDAVLELRDVGMSTRAISAAIGASKSTVADDIAGVQNRTPDNPVIEVVGTDGKTYTQPKQTAPAQRRRSPINDEARKIGGELRRVTNRLEKLTADDRCPTERSLHYELRRVAAVAQELMARIEVTR